MLGLLKSIHRVVCLSFVSAKARFRLYGTLADFIDNGIEAMFCGGISHMGSEARATYSIDDRYLFPDIREAFEVPLGIE